MKESNFIKNLNVKNILFAAACLMGSWSFAQSIEIVPLGVYGGSDESNLSSYLVGIEHQNQYLAMDAGTINRGIQSAILQKTFTTDGTDVLRNYIKGYFISHGHLDHLSGMIINSPEDSKKPIYGTAEMIEVLKNNYFTNASWANFGSEGESPILNKYQYVIKQNLEQFELLETGLKGQLFELSHVNPWKSSALKVSTATQSLMYFGDTGADRIEKTNHLRNIWKTIAPEIKSGKLKTLMLEVSFPNHQPEHLLFGHLTPRLMMEEMHHLSKYTGKEALKSLNIIVTHIKPKDQYEEIIKKELQEANDLELNFIYPKQGKRIVIQ